jgi:FkbH-like protein
MDIDRTDEQDIDIAFDEEWYLRQNSDIAEAVRRGGFPSGKHHYLRHGRNEGRLPVPPPPDSVASKQRTTIPFWEHNSERFLAPAGLAVTETRLNRIALIGSCSIWAWDLQRSNPVRCPADLIVVNNIANLPELEPEVLAAYDFAVIQVPFRTVLSDHELWHIAHADNAAYQAAFEHACANLRTRLHLWMQWNREHGMLTFVANYFVPQQNPMGRLVPRHSLANPEYFVLRINEYLETLVLQNKNAYILDLDRLSASIGRRYIQDDSLAAIAHNGPMSFLKADESRIEPMAAMIDHYELQPLLQIREMLWAELLAMYRTVHQIDPVKVVVVDLDDTLWQGISGELQEFSAGMLEGWPGGLVEALVYLKKRGILLAIASKNEEARIREIWPLIFGPRLRLEDFAAIRINWRPKAENVREILEGMNLLPRNAVFIDDNPAEREAMQRAFPDMRILGQHPYYLRRTLLWSPETQVPVVTEESSQRTEMVQAQFAREAQRQQMSREQFLQDAAPTVTMLWVDNTDHPRFARVFELINKTNQFNTTGRRWKIEECEEYFRTGGQLAAFEVADHFTTYGLVGVVILRPGTIEQWVMSCRILGYQIEEAVMAILVANIRASLPGPVTGRLVHTDANFPCRDLFSKCGFIDPDSTGNWVLPPDATPAVPEHVTIR